MRELLGLIAPRRKVKLLESRLRPSVRRPPVKRCGFCLAEVKAGEVRQHVCLGLIDE